MNKNYWDGNASTYEDSILSVFKHDRAKIIRKNINQLMPPEAIVADFGCGIGSGIPLLSSKAKHVYAIDLSEENLQRAQLTHRKLQNVNYMQCDLASKRPIGVAFDFAISVNCLISPSQKLRTSILKTIAASMRRASLTLFVVPSFESNMWVYRRFYECALKQRKGHDRALSIANGLVQQEIHSIPEGIFNMDGVKTKFFQGPELDLWLRENGFKVVQRIALEYGWEAEIDNPPKWLGTPRPWHWLVVGQKIQV